MIDRHHITGTSTRNDAPEARGSSESRPATETATRGEPRGAARMNTSGADHAPYQWQADGEG